MSGSNTFKLCIGALNVIHSMNIGSIPIDSQKLNQANVFIDKLLKNDIPLDFILRFLKNGSIHVQFFGFRMMEVQIRKSWNSKFSVNDKRRLMECILSFVLQVDLTTQNKKILCEKISHIFFEIIHRDWPHKNEKLLENIMNQLISKKKNFMCLKILDAFFVELSNEHSLDINIKRHNSLKKHIRKSGLIGEICKFYFLNFKNSIAISQQLKNITSTIFILEENEFVVFLPFLFQSLKINSLRKNASTALVKVSALVRSKFNAFFNKLSSLVDFKIKEERDCFIRCFEIASSKINLINNQVAFFHTFLKLLKLPLSGAPFTPDEKTVFFEIARNFMKEYNSERHKNCNIYEMFTMLLKISMMSEHSKAFVERKGDFIKSGQHEQYEWQYLKSYMSSVFQSVVVHIPEQILQFALNQMYQVEKFKSIAQLEYFCTLFEWTAKKVKDHVQKEYINKYNMLLKKVLDVYLLTSNNNNNKTMFTMNIMNNKKNLELMIKCLKNFGVCYEANFESMKMTLQKLFYISVKFPFMRAYILEEWILFCNKHKVVLIKRFNDVMDISNRIKSVYNVKELILFYEGLIMVMDKSPDYTTKNGFLNFIFSKPLQQLFAKNTQKSISSPELLLKTVIVPSNNNPKSCVFHVLFLFASISTKIKNDSLSVYLVKMLPSVITLLKSYHFLYHPNILKTLPNNVKSSFLFLTSQNEHFIEGWEESKSKSGRIIMFKNNRLWDALDLKWNCYAILGYCSGFMREFWANKNLLNILAGSVFLNLQFLPLPDLKFMLKGFLYPFIEHCPKKLYNKVLSVVLLNVFGMLSQKLNEKVQFQSVKEEMFYYKNKSLVFKEIGCILNLFTKEVEGVDLRSFFIFRQGNEKIMYIILEMIMKILYHNTLKYFHLYHDFLLYVIPALAKNSKYDQIISFYLLRTLLYVLTYSNDYFFHNSVIALITRILTSYLGRPKYVDYIFVAIGNVRGYKNLKDKIKIKGIKFKGQKKSVKFYLKKISGKKKNLNLNLNSIQIKEEKKFSEIFRKYNTQFVQRAFNEKTNINRGYSNNNNNDKMKM